MHTIDFYDDPVDEMLNPIKKPLSEEDEKMMNEFSEPADYKEIPATPGIPKGAKFNVREGDFEVKLGHSNLSDPYLVTPELVKYAKDEYGEYCWTLAFWRYNDHEDYWSMDPVGSRIFEDIPTGFVPRVWRLMKMMDDYLNQRED